MTDSDTPNEQQKSTTEPADGGSRESAPASTSHARSGMTALTVAALGVVFGDIGTSPLYSLQTVFTAGDQMVKATPSNVYGVISLVFWAISLIVSLKYVTFIMRADNNGEGGEMALISMIQRSALRKPWAKALLIALGLCGVSLFFGDGIITPAISVLSAVEGLNVVAPSLSNIVVPVTLVVMVLLFSIQRFGTGAVGGLFGPVMGIWFASLALGGLNRVAHSPSVIKALSPTYAVEFFLNNRLIAFLALASVVLAVTGAETLYADMGHFGRPAIRRAWFFAAFPALTLNYLGQATMIVHDPRALEGVFFILFPDWARIPMVILATVATVIASQAVITGVFSVSRQAVQLGFLPRLTIFHTSEKEQGQVYVPALNWTLFVGVVMIVLGFESSARLASAYGFAVTGTFLVSTVLFLFVIRVIWKKSVWTVVLAGLIFFPIDLSFFGANLHKIPEGGWLPIVIAAAAFIVLTTWQRGREIVTANRSAQEGLLHDFIEQIHNCKTPLIRVPGTAVFLNPNIGTAPLAMRANVEHNRALHESVVIVSVQIDPFPHVDSASRLDIDDLGYADDGIFHLTAHYGFKDSIDVPAALQQAVDEGRVEIPIDLDGCSYFLSRINLTRTDDPGMSGWRKRLFIAIARHAANPVDYFNLPIDRTVIMGGHVNV